MTIQQILSIPWLRGFIEADGSFQIHLSGQQINIVAKISQKTNSNLLPLIKTMLKGHGIECVIYDPNKAKNGNPSGRASDLLVRGRNNIEKFIKLLKSDGSSFTFISQKQRDLHIIEEILNNKNLSKGQVLGLKKSLHKSNRNENDLIKSGILPRKDWENRFGLPEGASVIETEQILKKIDKIYSSHKNKVEKSLQNLTFKINDDFFVGLIDGDGGYGISITKRKANPHHNVNHLDWEEHLCFTMEKSADLTIKALLYRLNSNVKIKTKGSFGGGAEVLLRKKAEISSLIEMHEKFPLRGNYRQEQFSLILELRRLKQTRDIKKYTEVCKFIDEVYRVSAISKKGKPRTPPTVEEAKIEFKDYVQL